MAIKIVLFLFACVAIQTILMAADHFEVLPNNKAINYLQRGVVFSGLSVSIAFGALLVYVWLSN